MPAGRLLALLMMLAAFTACALACGPSSASGPAAAAEDPEPPAAEPPRAEPVAPPTETVTDTDTEADEEPQPEPPEPAAKRVPPGAMTTGMLGTAFSQAVLIQWLARAEPLSFRPVNGDKTVFRVKLAGVPFEAAFKAATHDRPNAALAEIGAAAVARCLGIDTVPAAVGRSVPLDLIRRRVEGVTGAEWLEIAGRLLTSKSQRVPGAFIYWIPDLQEIGLSRDRGLPRAREWLRIGGALPDDERSLARSVSVMLGYDYIIGNFDRWSGSNAKGNADKSSVYVRDHDLALPGNIGEPLHKRLAEHMTMAERVSRGLYAYAQGLDRECIEREVALAQDQGEGAERFALTLRMIAGVLDRRDGFLSHVQALVAQHGDQAVLFFD